MTYAAGTYGAGTWGSGTYAAGNWNPLLSYVALRLPNTPSARRQAIADAAILAANGQAYSAASVIDAIALTLYYQKDDLSCFQDSAATTPASLGQVVGAVTPWSGTGNITQATTAAKPQFTADGILFDGADDRLIRTLSYGASNTIIVAGRRTGGSNQGCFAGGHFYDLDLRCDLFQIQNGPIIVGAYSVAINEKVILSGLRQSGGSKVWKNGVQSGATQTSALNAIAGSNFYVGARNDAAIPLTGSIYSLFYAPYSLPDSDRIKIERFANFYNAMGLF